MTTKQRSDSARSAKSSILIAKCDISLDKNTPPNNRPCFKCLWLLATEQLPSREHWSIVVKFLSKSIVIKLTSKWSQLSGRGVAELSVVKPKFADFFRWRRFTRHNHCVQIFATFPMTQGDLLENQEERS